MPQPSSNVLRSLRVLLHKEFLQIARDKVIVRMLFIMPMIQLLVLANAASFEVKTSKLWVVDQDRTSAARALINRFTAGGRFTIAGYSVVAAPGDDALLDGSANAILVIPHDFGRDLVREQHAPLQLVLNAENGSQAGVIQSYASAIIAQFAIDLGTDAAVSRVSQRPRGPTMEVRTSGRFNTSLDYKRFMVPGILAQLVTLVGTLMTALNIVREKEAGTLDQLNVTPIKPAVFIAAKLLPLVVIGLIEFSLGLILATTVFSVPVAGSIPALFAGASLFLLAALGIGLWISTISETQQQALFVTFSFMMIYILMSGLFTPVRAMPGWVQSLAQINPLMHFIALIRAVMLKGAGFTDVWYRLASLAGIGVTVLALAVAQYRKRAA